MIGVLETIGNGGLIAYGVNRLEMYRGAAVYVERLLKGAKPSELPINRVANYDLVIDRKVAARLGVAIPQTLLLRANRVIDEAPRRRLSCSPHCLPGGRSPHGRRSSGGSASSRDQTVPSGATNGPGWGLLRR